MRIVFQRDDRIGHQIGNFECELYESIQLKEKSDKRPSPFAWKTFSVPFKAGLLLLFPSHFRHSVPRNETQYVRKSVSMNIVPKGMFGDPHSLTELLFHKVL